MTRSSISVCLPQTRTGVTLSSCSSANGDLRRRPLATLKWHAMNIL
eukprot:CAMPEP_0113230292 /NCGR_PEP_ID=MMETSP0008_2-20120614/814_1 /TAXON_ID=97485 /ORGANISM="Prymnesium parvum" /LENGTH=45 /DNA_ID=CAMNT_0000076881 /DNA_START=211 /DNA_END=345 /DNA_ORIENTATION=- /assembly_acc=CAM_ASM_000153